MVDPIKASRVHDKEIKSQLDRMEIQEALRHGNIYEVFAKSKVYKISEFFDFFGKQHQIFKSSVIQDSDVKSSEAMYYEPDISQFVPHHREVALTPEEAAYFSQQMNEYAQRMGEETGTALRSRRFKATENAGGSGEGDGPMTIDEVADSARNTLGQWENFMSDTWSQILDNQMMSDLKSKAGEMQNEVRRLYALAKQGAAGPEFLLIALAKVNSMKNGVIMSWLGKKAFHINESLTRIANDLHTLSPGDPRYASEMQMAQAKTREGGFQLNLLVTDMQKVMQDMASTLEQVHGMIGEINRTRREIVTKIAAH